MTDKVPTFKKVFFEPALQHIFPNKKIFRAQVRILVLKWSGRDMAMNFVALCIVIALVFIVSPVWQTARPKGLLFGRKNTPELFL